MYWLQRPPHLRRAVAVLIVIAAIAWDLHETQTEPYPVAARHITRGAVITDADIAWIHLPARALPTPDLGSVTAAIDMAPGDPLATAARPHVPQDWWTIAIGLEAEAMPGDDVLLLVADPPFSAIGVVLTPQSGDAFSLDHRPATIAVPADVAPLVAAAEQEGRLITAARPSTDPR